VVGTLGRPTLLVVRARLRRHWRSTIAVGLLIGLVGGVVLAALAGSRHVQTSYDRLLDDIDAYDLVATTCDHTGCHTDEIRQKLTASGLVERTVAGVTYSQPAISTADGRPLAAPGSDDPCATGDHERTIWAGPGRWASDGQVPMRVEDGRTFDARALEVLVPRITAERAGISAGDTLLLAGPCADDRPQPWSAPLRLRVAGIGVGPLDVDTPTVEGTLEVVLASPAVMTEIDRRGWPQGGRAEGLAVWAAPGVEATDIAAVMGHGERSPWLDVGRRAEQVRADLEPDATTLRLLAVLVALAGALVLTPVLARQLRVTGGGEAVLPALGATRRQRTGHGLAYAVVVGTVGAISALMVGHAVSRWVPRGLAESIEADPGWRSDPSVMVVGALAVVAATGALAALPAWSVASVRAASGLRSPGPIARLAARVQLGPGAGTGVRAALGASEGQRSLPTLQGALALAVALGCVAGAQTFSAGLTELRATPRLAGWGWDALVFLDEDGCCLDEVAATRGVERATGGVMWAGTEGAVALLVNGGDELEVVPRAFAAGPDAITPVVVDGRPATTADEIVVDGSAADGAGLHVGDTVELAVPDPARALASGAGVDVGPEEWGLRPRSYEIVGVGPLLRFGQPVPVVVLTLEGMSRLLTPTTDEWSDLAAQLTPTSAARLQAIDLTSVVRPQIAFVDVEGEPRAAEGLLADVSTEVAGFDDGRAVIEQLWLVDLSRASRVPDVLGRLFAVVSMGVAAVLVAGVTRGRRRDLAVLRALGFSNRQLRRSAVWQASCQVLLPAAVGIPLGVLVGQRVWKDYAESIGIVPSGAIGWPALLAFLAVALLLANAVALVVAHRVARHPAPALRAE
jgi:hypothetical protein